MNQYNILLQLLKSRRYITIKATGNSMLPTIKSGDNLIVDSNLENLKIGDIVLYSEITKKTEIFIVHRIVACVEDKIYLTKGDNNNMYDKPVRKSKIIGRIIEIQSAED